MKLEKIDLRETRSFSSAFLDYLKEKPELRSFYNFFPKPENFKQFISTKSFPSDNRKILQKVLIQQYQEIPTSLKVKENIDLLLKEDTFTITTGHQLNIFTGPLYFIYKILTVVNVCKRLKEEYPEYNFVPVYWMASEDHDFEEINHFYLYGNKYEWKTEAKGAVGRLSPHEIEDAIKEAGFIPEKFKEAYQKSKNLSEATREIVNELFGHWGVVIVNPDNKELKKEFSEVIKKEITGKKSFEIVKKTTQNLESMGYKGQIHPREINLFYLEDGLRERIEWDGNIYKVLNTNIAFSEADVLKLIEDEPEKFSPNVVLRPLYQETILPNLAYIGGPAEIIYWLQLKEVFDYYNVSFPSLMPRNFALIINEANIKKINKLNVPLSHLFLEENLLKTAFIENNSNQNFHLNKEATAIEQIFDLIREKAEKIDRSLIDFVGAESHKVKTIIEGIEKKLKKAEERKQEVAINQLLGLKAKLFPNGELQERHDNFLNFYIQDSNFIDRIAQQLDPFDFRFNIFLEEQDS